MKIGWTLKEATDDLKTGAIVASRYENVLIISSEAAPSLGLRLLFLEKLLPSVANPLKASRQPGLRVGSQNKSTRKRNG
ncbi:hypothetical protein [Propionivibrio sp.]|uniref:hypothetical protein n=1 Tax=Propionivibrio sp. TaxID=2212460 RepID=UPI003BF43851